ELAQLQILSRTNNQQLLATVLPKILFWPLTATCAVRVLNKDEYFKPEYIIPQLLLQYVKEDTKKQIDGIRYFSNHNLAAGDSLELGSNLVFPVKTSGPRDLCPSLTKLFTMTAVLPWKTHMPGGRWARLMAALLRWVQPV